MIKLPQIDNGKWQLPNHAHIVVYGANEQELITIYRCGAAQDSPVVQEIGNIVNIHVDNTLSQTKTGYIARLNEPSILYTDDHIHFSILQESE
ncbi:MAG: hypothetical protein ABEI06_06740 [Halobacteriaceae archaeon]